MNNIIKFQKKEQRFKCLECGETSFARDINDVTEEYFEGNCSYINSDISRISSCFVCPQCRDVIDGINFEEIY